SSSCTALSVVETRVDNRMTGRNSPRTGRTHMSEGQCACSGMGAVVARGRVPTWGMTWPLSGLLVALFLTPVLLGLSLVPQSRIYAQAAQIADLGTYPVLLAAVAALYVSFRLSPDPGVGWVSAAAVFGAVQGVGYAALPAALVEEVRMLPGWLLLCQVVVTGMVCLMLAAADKLRLLADPAVLGVSLALAATAARLLMVERIEPAQDLSELAPVLGVVLVLS